MTPLGEIEIGLTEHLEGPIEASSADVYRAVADLAVAADALGVRYAWFAEHHLHAHLGHLPAPLLLALHVAGRTRQLSPGTAVLSLPHRQPIDVAEQVAVADTLSGGRLAIGFGSGSSPRESALFGVPDVDEAERHARYARLLDQVLDWWSGPSDRLPRPIGDLGARCWSAVNSVGAATLAGERNLNALFSHLRTPAQYRTYADAYRSAGGRGRIAANRPLLIAESDAAARELGDAAIRVLWRRFRSEGKIADSADEPRDLGECCRHPINFIVGGPASVADQMASLYRESPFDVLNVEVTWAGLADGVSVKTLDRLMNEVLPRLRTVTSA